MPVISGLGRTPYIHGFWKRSSVHPDLTPHALLLVRDQHAARRGSDDKAPAAADGMGQQIARKPERIAGDERIVRGSEVIVPAGVPVGLPLLEQRLAGRRHRRLWIGLVVDRPDPHS